MSQRIDPELGPVQICRDCGLEKPLTPEFWHKDAARDCGLRTACKICVNKSTAVSVTDKYQQTLSRLENMGMELLDKLCETPVSAGKRLPHIADMFQATMNVFGGVEGFARQVASTYYAAKPGSQTRQRIMDSTARWGIKASEMGMIERDLKNVSTEDLERFLSERMREQAIEVLPRILEMKENAETNDQGLSGPLADAC